MNEYPKWRKWLPNPQKLAEKYRKLIAERMPKIETAHDERSHFYVMNGVKYPSVTAKLQMLKDEGLMNYKMNKALEYVQLDLPNRIQDIMLGKFEVISEMIKNAKLAPVKEFEGAGSIGTAVHSWREAWFRKIIEDSFDPNLERAINPIDDPSIISGQRAIQKFMKDTSYIPIACELYLVDPDLNIGGTLDDIGILPGEYKVPLSDPVLGDGYKIRYKPKLVLIDLKTSNIGNKTSYFLQVALYYAMFKKLTGINIKEFYILHVSKEDGTYKLIPIDNMSQLIKDAKTLLKLHAAVERITESKKKEPIIV